MKQNKPTNILQIESNFKFKKEKETKRRERKRESPDLDLEHQNGGQGYNGGGSGGHSVQSRCAAWSTSGSSGGDSSAGAT